MNLRAADIFCCINAIAIRCSTPPRQINMFVKPPSKSHNAHIFFCCSILCVFCFCWFVCLARAVVCTQINNEKTNDDDARASIAISATNWDVFVSFAFNFDCVALLLRCLALSFSLLMLLLLRFFQFLFLLHYVSVKACSKMPHSDVFLQRSFLFLSQIN